MISFIPESYIELPTVNQLGQKRVNRAGTVLALYNVIVFCTALTSNTRIVEFLSIHCFGIFMTCFIDKINIRKNLLKKPSVFTVSVCYIAQTNNVFGA